VPQESRVAVKLAYDGSKFYGYQRQPRKRTVEGALIDALVDLDAIGSAKGARLQSSSRTDRGVSAICNVVSFTTDFPLKALCSAINSQAEDLWTYSARRRWYRYHLRKDAQDIGLMRTLAERFEGTHDFSGFSRKDDRDPIRTIDSVEVSDAGRFILIDLKAESYLWNMVRRIVWMIDAGSAGSIDEGCIGPDATRRPRRIGLAPAEFLLLMDVECGIEFPTDMKAVASVREVFEDRLQRRLFEQEFSRHLLNVLHRQ
jgi:tRNA pseudouridine38-40 synthase